MKAISLDIETLGTNSDAVVLSIGACVVTPDGVQKEGTFYSCVNIQQQIDLGRSITEGTLRFWFEQEQGVIQNSFGVANGPSIREVMSNLLTWIKSNGSPSVYCKGPQFDAAILDSMADSAKVERPIGYRKWRDIRTLEETITWAGHEDMLNAQQENASLLHAHDALDDAFAQGETIHLAMLLCVMENPDATR
jgi:DNA polymerase III epsilon subunit-like protein